MASPFTHFIAQVHVFSVSFFWSSSASIMKYVSACVLSVREVLVSDSGRKQTLPLDVSSDFLKLFHVKSVSYLKTAMIVFHIRGRFVSFILSEGTPVTRRDRTRNVLNMRNSYWLLSFKWKVKQFRLVWLVNIFLISIIYALTCPYQLQIF
jgi:hypothetical protein